MNASYQRILMLLLALAGGGYSFLACAADAPVLVLDPSGLPTTDNYTNFVAGGPPSLTSATANSWLNCQTGKDLTGIAAYDSESATPYHLRLTVGSGTTPENPNFGNNNNNSAVSLGTSIEAASLWISSGRFVKGSVDLSKVGSLYLSGGQLSCGANFTYPGAVTLGTSTYTETGGGAPYSGAILRVDSNPTFSGTVRIAQDAKFTYGSGARTLTFGSMTGPGALTFDSYNNGTGTLVASAVSGYTGTITLQSTMKFQTGSVAGDLSVALTGGDFAPAQPAVDGTYKVTLSGGTFTAPGGASIALTQSGGTATLGNNSTLSISMTGGTFAPGASTAITGASTFAGTLDFSAITLNATVAPFTLAAGASLTVAPGTVVALGKNYALPLTVKIASLGAGATTAGWDKATFIDADSNELTATLSESDPTLLTLAATGNAALILDENGLPLASNYTQTIAGNPPVIPSPVTGNLEVQTTAAIDYPAIDAYNATNDTLYHLRLNGTQQSIVTAPIRAASVWVNGGNSRYKMGAGSSLDNVGHLYTSGSQLWFVTPNAVYTPDVTVGASSWRETSYPAYDLSNFRVDLNVTFSGTMRLAQNAKAAFGLSSGSTLTLGTLTGPGNFTLASYSNRPGKLAPARISDYTGTIAVPTYITLETDAVTGDLAVNLSGGTFTAAQPATSTFDVTLASGTFTAPDGAKAKLTQSGGTATLGAGADVSGSFSAGTLTLGANATYALGMTGGSLTLGGGTTAINGAAAFANAVDFSAITLNDTAAPFTVAAGASLTVAPGTIITLGKNYALPLTVKIADLGADATTTGWDKATYVMGEQIQLTATVSEEDPTILTLASTGNAILYLDSDGLPDAKSYTSTYGGNPPAIPGTVTNNFVANITGTTAIAFPAITAYNEETETLYHIRLGGTAGSTITQPIRAASVWINGGNSRYRPAAGSVFDNVGHIYLSGSQMWPNGTVTYTPDMTLGTCSWSESNTTFGGALLRIGAATTLSGVIRIAQNIKAGFGSDSTLTFGTLTGPGNLALARDTGTNLLVLNRTEAYTGTITVPSSMKLESHEVSGDLAVSVTGGYFTPFQPASGGIYKVTQSGGTFFATNAVSATVTQSGGTINAGSGTTLAFTQTGGTLNPARGTTLGKSSLTGGTINLTGLALDSGETLFNVTQGATVSVGGATFTLGKTYDLPLTTRLFSDVESITGLESARFDMLGAILAATANEDGTLTLDIRQDPVAFTKPSADWDAKTFPATAAVVIPPGGYDLGLTNLFIQPLNGTDSMVAQIPSGGTATTDIFGGVGGSTYHDPEITRDIWVKVTGGTIGRIMGGYDNAVGRSTALTGDILVNVTGGTTVKNIVGGNSGGAGPTSEEIRLTGNTAVVVEGQTIVSGNIIGGGVSYNNMQAPMTGNSIVVVKTLQPTSTEALNSLPAGHIIGGSSWVHNNNSTTENTGDTAVVIELAEGTAGVFNKTIIGGSYANGTITSTASTVSGNTSVSITAPAGVTFARPIYGAGYAGRNTQSQTLGNSSVTITGGTYTNLIAAAGGAVSSDAPVAGSATLTLSGGTFNGALLRGTDGTATAGSTALVVDGSLTLAGATAQGFGSITLKETALLSGYATFGSPVTIESGASLEVTPVKENPAAANLLTLNAAVTGKFTLLLPEDFNSENDYDAYYILKGIGATPATITLPKGYMVRQDEIGLYLTRAQGTVISLY